jgi:hypothetical protein
VGSIPLFSFEENMDISDIKVLLEIIESANPPNHMDGANDNIILDAKDKWKVVFFYDNEELDYIDSLISPSGEVIDPWDWPWSIERNTILGWQKVGSIEERLKFYEENKR